MERLTVENFLTIKRAEFDVGRINVIIGPQASGKSVLAKLLYFFREFLDETCINSIPTGNTKRDLDKRALFYFEQYFPKYTWINQYFIITYRINDFFVLVSRLRSGKGKGLVTLEYSDELIRLRRKLRQQYKKKEKEMGERKKGPLYKDLEVFSEVLKDFYASNAANNFQASEFIPANRSFFANLQKNVFSLLAKNIVIDPFITRFGRSYEKSRSFYSEGFGFGDKSKSIGLRKKIEDLIEAILAGKYRYEDEQDWIENKSRKINLANASSGQQEALPMLITIASWPIPAEHSRITLFIEEPEAHLFPTSQKHMVSLFGLLYGRFNNSFVITTHSPYVLTAMNNLILAYDVKISKGDAAIAEIVDVDFLIKYEDVKAYTIQNGELQSILNDETRLIGTNIIDSVSDEFDCVFDALLKLQMEGQC